MKPVVACLFGIGVTAGGYVPEQLGIQDIAHGARIGVYLRPNSCSMIRSWPTDRNFMEIKKAPVRRASIFSSDEIRILNLPAGPNVGMELTLTTRRMS